MDVLQYTAFNQQVEYQKQIREKEDCYRTLVNDKVSSSGGSGLTGTAGLVCWLENIEPCLLWKPVNWANESVIGMPKYWDCIPTGSGWTGGIKVCDASGYYRCGCSCTWTVPAGVTCARFQLWGAGGASSASKNYGFSPFGSTGAYASAIIPVTAGCSYTICAGCAYCCYSSYGSTGRVSGCKSWVQGAGLCRFCAEGGQGTLRDRLAMAGVRCQARFTDQCCTEAGGCLCQSGNYICNAQNCSMCKGPMKFTAGSMYHGCLTCPDLYTEAGLSENSVIYGIRGIWSQYCHDYSQCGYDIHPPIYGFEMETQCCTCWTTGSCCGYCCGAYFGKGCLRYPSAGGWGTYMNSGSDASCGDAGKFGMVCISYK